MKKTLLIVTLLALALGASYAMAEQTKWAGTYWDPAGTTVGGTWKGTLYVNEPDGSAPHFKGEWIPDDGTVGGALYADLTDDGSGIYTVIKGIIYKDDGVEIGNWYGYFDLISGDTGYAEGKWKLFDDPSLSHYGLWKGKQIF